MEYLVCLTALECGGGGGGEEWAVSSRFGWEGQCCTEVGERPADEKMASKPIWTRAVYIRSGSRKFLHISTFELYSVPLFQPSICTHNRAHTEVVFRRSYAFEHYCDSEQKVRTGRPGNGANNSALISAGQHGCTYLRLELACMTENKILHITCMST